MVLGDPTSLGRSLQALGNKLAIAFQLKVRWDNPSPVIREKPWLLPNLEPDAPSNK